MIISRKIFAVVALGALALATAARAGDREVLKYCMEDVQRLCAGVQPGGGRIMKCLKANKEGMSVGCAQGLMKLKGGK